MRLHNTNPRARLQGTAAAIARATEIYVSSPAERCAVLLIAANHGDMGMGLAKLTELSDFASVTPWEAEAVVRNLIVRGVLDQDGERIFMVAV